MTTLSNYAPIDANGNLLVTTVVPTPAWPSVGGFTYDPVTMALAVIDAVPAANDPWLGGMRHSSTNQLYVWSGAFPSPVFYNRGLPVTADGRLVVSSSGGGGGGWVGGWPIGAGGGVPVTGLAAQPIFFAPLTNSLIPTTAGNPAFTFARATLAYAMDQDGILRQAQMNEARFQGARRVANILINSSENFASGSWTVDGGVTVTAGQADPLGGSTASKIVTATPNTGVYNGPFPVFPSLVYSVWMRGEVGGEVVNIGAGSAAPPVTLTTSWKRYTTADSSGNQYMEMRPHNTANVTFYVWHAQVEAVSGQSNQAPGEYVSVGVLAAPYHGNWIDGVKYFPTYNGNNVPGINLVLWSQDFDNAAWTKQLSTITANTQTAPDGTLTADTFADNATSGFHQISSANITALTLATYTYSIYLKQGTATWVQMVCSSGSGSRWANFNLATGAIGNKEAGTVAAIASVGNGWYRCSITGNASATANVLILGLPSNSSYPFSYAGSGQTVHLWGSQFAAGSSPIGYNPTTTAAGVTSNVVTEATGALIPAATMLGYVAENAATNMLPQSQTFDDAVWIKDNSTITANTQGAPDGTLTADTFADTASNSEHRVFVNNGLTVTVGQSYTFSIYAKAGTLTWMQMAASGRTPSAWSNFNLVTGALGNKDGAATVATIKALANGWYRCSISFTADAIGSFFIAYGNSGNVFPPSYIGTGQTMYLWGAQVEQASDPSSYIPTTTVAVVRNVDSLSYPKAGNVNALVGTSYTEPYFPSAMAGVYQLILSDPSFYYQDLISSTKGLSMYSGPEITSANVRTLNATNKAATAWSGVTSSVCLNGGAVATGAFGAFGATGSFTVGNGAGAPAMQGIIRNVKFYATRLTDVELQGLTT